MHNRSKKHKNNIKKSLKVQKNQRKLRNSNELRFRELLLTYSITFIWQYPYACEDRYVCVDFFIPEMGLVIEIDGYGHDYNKDLIRTQYIKKIHGVKEVLRITNKQLANDYDSVEEFVSSLAR